MYTYTYTCISYISPANRARGQAPLSKKFGGRASSEDGFFSRDAFRRLNIEFDINK